MEIAQAILMIMFAIFAIIGDGGHTVVRLYVSWIIIFIIIAICLSYLIFSIICFIIWGCKKYRNVDYIEEWAKNSN
jgi:hypothetical protein